MLTQFKALLPSGHFSLRTLFVAITLIAIWLGFQVRWMQQRQEARQWIEQHEHDGWSKIDPKDVVTSSCPAKSVPTPWNLRLMGEAPLFYIHLDKTKLTEADVDRINSLPALFPEAFQIQVSEPGWTTCWPPLDGRGVVGGSAATLARSGYDSQRTGIRAAWQAG